MRIAAWSCCSSAPSRSLRGVDASIVLVIGARGTVFVAWLPLAPSCMALQSAGRSKLQGVWQQQYIELQRAPAEEREARGCVVAELAGLAGLQRWAAARAQHHPNGRPPQGQSPGTLQAMAGALGMTVVCLSCGAFVHLNAARRAAHACGRTIFLPGDGCASRTCTRTHAQPARFAGRQARMAAALLAWRRALVLWPPTTAARVAQVAAPPALTQAIAREVASREPPNTAVPTAASWTAVRATAASKPPAAARASLRCRPAAAPRVGGRYYVTSLEERADLNGLPCEVLARHAGRCRAAVLITRCGEVEVVSLAPTSLRAGAHAHPAFRSRDTARTRGAAA